MEPKNLRLQLEKAMDTRQIQLVLQQLLFVLENQLTEKEFVRLKQIAMYQENAFSPAATEQSVKAAKERMLHFLANRPMVKQEATKRGDPAAD